jgi:hypothetical protein
MLAEVALGTEYAATPDELAAIDEGPDEEGAGEEEVKPAFALFRAERLVPAPEGAPYINLVERAPDPGLPVALTPRPQRWARTPAPLDRSRGLGDDTVPYS